MFGIGNSSNAFLILRTQEIGASLETTILIYAAFNLVAALISYPAGALSDTWGRKNLLLASFVVFLIAYLGFALTKISSRRRAIRLLRTVSGDLPCRRQGLAADFVPDHLRASGIGWYSTTVGLLQLVASVVAGLLWDRIGHAAVFYYGAAFGLMGSIALLILVREEAEKHSVKK